MSHPVTIAMASIAGRAPTDPLGPVASAIALVLALATAGYLYGAITSQRITHDRRGSSISTVSSGGSPPGSPRTPEWPRSPRMLGADAHVRLSHIEPLDLDR